MKQSNFYWLIRPPLYPQIVELQDGLYYFCSSEKAFTEEQLKGKLIGPIDYPEAAYE